MKITTILITVCFLLTGVALANKNKEASVGLRSMAFKMEPKKIGISKSNYKKSVWGVIMESGFENGWYTLVVIADGTTSIYFSNGGGILGAGSHKAVREASKSYLAGAQQFYKFAKRQKQFPSPKAGEVRFYFLTFDGRHVYVSKANSLGNNKDKLSQLFHAAHRVIGEIRKTQGK